MTVSMRAGKKNSQVTRLAILDAAELEFARAGIVGARTEAIAEAVGVTRAMIHYYYETKELLYRAVLERILADRIRNLQRMTLVELPVEVMLEKYVRLLIDDNLNNLNIAPILFFESIQNDGRYYKEIAIASFYDPLSNILTRGVAEGKFRKVDTTFAAINIVGLAVFYLLARDNLKHLFPPDTNSISEDMIQRFTSEVLSFVMGGVLAPPTR